ncbi:uncharacterized protein LOC124450829 isoform X3 [Xenia sp. Carnegie-2017]|uniref:uncharacterized protein LOC124450829 isoform X3 n=1 Tax=Xenia sp. Carnegie-2017 TaxID=2897299 RepID=UPI001F041432|nr:uncharacterized protein LOC124450829 isoform X3 [Xenia sp. Carnegie-2017]
MSVLSSDAKTNGFKLMRLIVDVGGEALRITLMKQLSEIHFVKWPMARCNLMLRLKLDCFLQTSLRLDGKAQQYEAVSRYKPATPDRIQTQQENIEVTGTVYIPYLIYRNK